MLKSKFHDTDLKLYVKMIRYRYIGEQIVGKREPATWNVKTLKAVGRDLFDLQWEGSGEQRMHGEPVWVMFA